MRRGHNEDAAPFRSRVSDRQVTRGHVAVAQREGAYTMGQRKARTRSTMTRMRVMTSISGEFMATTVREGSA